MSGIHYLKQFDKVQLWRLFIDGRYHKKYDGWVGYEAGNLRKNNPSRKRIRKPDSQDLAKQRSGRGSGGGR